MLKDALNWLRRKLLRLNDREEIPLEICLPDGQPIEEFTRGGKTGLLCPECGSRNWGPSPLKCEVVYKEGKMVSSKTLDRASKKDHACYSCGCEFDNDMPYSFDNLNGVIPGL